ncbi:hypothetical protein [Aureimonas endophytica]|nr:hypothetical protein [Aureimonas endophytica]
MTNGRNKPNGEAMPRTNVIDLDARRPASAPDARPRSGRAPSFELEVLTGQTSLYWRAMHNLRLAARTGDSELRDEWIEELESIVRNGVGWSLIAQIEKALAAQMR